MSPLDAGLSSAQLTASLLAAAALGLTVYSIAQRTPSIEVGKAPIAQNEPSSKPVSASSISVSYRVTSDMADEHGRMFAGEILKLIDIVAGVASRRHAERNCVTIMLDRFILVQEVKVGDLIFLTASVNRAWNSSMETGVKVMREARDTGRREYCCHAYLTFVALTPSIGKETGPNASIRLPGRPKQQGTRPPVKKITPNTLIEKKRYILAGHRRELRILRRPSTTGLHQLRTEVLKLSDFEDNDGFTPTDEEQKLRILDMERQLMADAVEAKDPTVLLSTGPDGENVVSVTPGLHEGLDAPVFRMSELQQVLDKRKRSRRDTWTDVDFSSPGNTGSWVHSPLRASKTLEGAGRQVPATQTFASTLHIVMPQHANSAGVLFGGQLMDWMEKTALIAAHRFRREGCCWTTAGMDGLEFKEAVAIGDVLTFRAVVTCAWNSSLEVYVCSHADVPVSIDPTASPRFTNECFISLVALSSNTGRAVPLETTLLVAEGSPAAQVLDEAHSRKIERLNMKEMLIKMYSNKPDDPLSPQ